MEGPVNEFSYAHSHLFYKDSFEELQKKSKSNLFFEQDGARSHTTIENSLGYIKPRIKKRDPQTLEELKRFKLEELNLIPKKLVEKCGQNYVKRLKK